MKTRITTLRKIANRIGFCVYTQGHQWILSSTEEEPLHYSIVSEREALMVGLRRADERGLLRLTEQQSVRNA
jgi:hypothetical protein